MLESIVGHIFSNFKKQKHKNCNVMRVGQQTTQHEQKIHGAAMRICLFAPEARFSTNRSTILQNLMVFREIR